MDFWFVWMVVFEVGGVARRGACAGERSREPSLLGRKVHNDERLARLVRRGAGAHRRDTGEGRRLLRVRQGCSGIVPLRAVCEVALCLGVGQGGLGGRGAADETRDRETTANDLDALLHQAVCTRLAVSQGPVLAREDVLVRVDQGASGNCVELAGDDVATEVTQVQVVAVLESAGNEQVQTART